MRKVCIALSQLIIVCVTFTATAQTRRALIFAIGNYPKDSGWPQISSLNDARIVDSVLKRQGFNDIKIIKDADATVQGISVALSQLISRCQQGDVVIVQFSSHGEQVEDATRHKADGLEECIVTWDAKLPERGRQLSEDELKRYVTGYYREDVFGTYVNKLREKLGPSGDLIVSLDMCHAGIGTRGSGKVRGGKDALVSATFDPSKLQIKKDDATAFSNTGSDVADEAGMGAYVVFGAAQADQLDYETDENGVGYGSLSYALSKALTNLPKEKNNTITYRSLFAQVESVMKDNTTQSPVLAGNGMDRQLFGGKFITQKPYLEIDHIDGNIVYIKGGKLAGLDSGAKIAIYKAGTVEPAKSRDKLLDTGTIGGATLYTAGVDLGHSPNLKNEAGGWVFVTTPVFKNELLKISVITKSRGGPNSPSFSPAEKKTIENDLRDLPGVVISAVPEMKIVKGLHVDSLISAKNGLLFDTIRSAVNDAAVLGIKIKRYMQYTFLKGIDLKDTDAFVEIKLIPVVNGEVDSAKIKGNIKADVFKKGDKFRIWVSNKSDQDLYVNILDIQPDGIINPVLPNSLRGIPPKDPQLLFPAHTASLFKNIITVNPPYGREIFKIFASPDPIDMEVIADTKGAGARGGNLSILESLVKDSFSTARGVDISLGDENGSTYNLYFDIVPK